MEKPIKTVRVSAGTRIYYFDAYKDKKGQPYISIAEVPTECNPGKKQRQRIFIHAEDLKGFSAALDELTRYIEKRL